MKLRMNQITDQHLLAYVDGQLDAGNIETVEEYLHNNAEKAQLVAEWQAQTKSIQALYGHVIDEPMPERLEPANLVRPSLAANFNGWQAVAAALILLVSGSAIGWFGRDALSQNPAPPPTLIAQAVEAHQLFVKQQIHPVEVQASNRPHLTNWLSNSLNRQLVVPETLPNGFSLVGGRLLPAGDGPAAQLMYERDDSRRITLYLTPKTQDQPDKNQFASVGNLDALYWANSQVTCTIVGDLTQAEMEEIAAAVFAALGWESGDYQIG